MNLAQVQKWKSMGKKVILSFGGAGMGGSWDGLNNCWDYCFGKEEYVVDRLVALNEQLGMDGVDIDYEYFYEDNQNDLGFTRGEEAIKFLTDVTVELRRKLPSDAIVTHAPMDADLVPDSAYFRMIQRLPYTLDFLMPQYYNGVTRAHVDGFDQSGVGLMAAYDHYQALVDDIFAGDATRVVFGFCIDECSFSGSNSGSQTSVSVMNQIQSFYPCHGGAFFWVVNDDVGGAWSESVNGAMNITRGCSRSADEEPQFTSVAPVVPVAPSTPIPSPVTTPFTAPTGTPFRAPVSLPVANPVASVADDQEEQGENTGSNVPDFYDPNNYRSSGYRYTAYSAALSCLFSSLM